MPNKPYPQKFNIKRNITKNKNSLSKNIKQMGKYPLFENKDKSSIQQNNYFPIEYNETVNPVFKLPPKSSRNYGKNKINPSPDDKNVKIGNKVFKKSFPRNLKKTSENQSKAKATKKSKANPKNKTESKTKIEPSYISDLKSEIKKDINDAVNKLIEVMNNGFAFLGRTLGEKYNYKEPSKTKSDEKSNYPIIENKDSSVSKNDDDKKKNESKIITNLSKVNFVSESSSNTEKNEVPKDSIENIEKSDSKKSDNEKVIKYDPGNILTSNNAYSKNATIKIESGK
jgi:hypothetical protein